MCSYIIKNGTPTLGPLKKTLVYHPFSGKTWMRDAAFYFYFLFFLLAGLA